MESFKTSEAEIFYQVTGDVNKAPVFWAHGWGQNHKSFDALRQSLEPLGHHHSIDFPGFGESPDPAQPWDTADYARAMAALIEQETDQPIIWIGHSFGCRVGLQLAAMRPDLVKGMILIAGAGLQRKRPLLKKLYMALRIYTFKALKTLITLGLNEEWLRSKFGSSDYKNTSGIMRQVFIKVVNEDLSAQAQNVCCPVSLIYGEQDTETPPEIGERLSILIKNAKMVRLPGQDHYSVLSTGRHQVAPLIKSFIEQLRDA